MSATNAQPLTITPIVVPETADSADAGVFRDMVRLANESCRHDVGHTDLDLDLGEVLAFWQDGSDWAHVGFAARAEDGVIGVGILRHSTQEGTSSAELDVWVDPARWAKGAQHTLLAAVEQEALRRGRRTVQTWTIHRPGAEGAAIVAPTGFGSVPAEDRQTLFMQEHGYRLEQVERNSVFDLHGSFDEITRTLSDALATMDPEYRRVEWTSPTPDAYLDSFAYVISRMNTDAPQGGLTVEEHHWDADRVRRRDERLRKQGMLVSVAAVEHVPTGTIVAYNELAIPNDHTGATQQFGTLVLTEHRGHRLGAIVKCANLMRWRDLVPESPRVSTFNAEENRPMLDINEALGFRPVSYAGAWQKELT